MARRIRYLTLAIGLPLLAGWIGFRREKQRLETGDTAPAPLRTSLKRVFIQPSDSASRLNELRGLAGPTALSDREKAEAWRIIRSFDLRQIQAYLEEIPLTGRNRAANDTLLAMLFARWTELDPPGAAGKILSLYSTGKAKIEMAAPLQAVLSTWLARDPEGALQWFQRDLGSKRIASRAVGIAAEFFIHQDPQTALERLDSATHHDPAASSLFITALAQRAAGSEEKRQQFFDLTRDLSGSSDLLRATFWHGMTDLAENWAHTDPAAALNGGESYSLSPAQLAEFRRSIQGAVAMRDSSMLLDWSDQQPGNTITHGLESFAYQHVLTDDPAKAIDWAERNSQWDLLSRTLDQQAKWASGSPSGDPYYPRQIGVIQQQFQAWQVHDPEAAGEWLERQQAKIHEALTSSPTHAGQ